MKTLTFSDNTSIQITDESEIHSLWTKVRTRSEAYEVWKKFTDTNLLSVTIDDGIEVREYERYTLDSLSVAQDTMLMHFALSPPLTKREKELLEEVARLRSQLNSRKEVV